jgi:hypothetical protein
MTEADMTITQCVTMVDGTVVIFEADDQYWYEPCWVIHGEDQGGHPTVRFMPVQKYGMSKAMEPFLREQYLCSYAAEEGIEKAYKGFVQRYREHVERNMN